jgi:hypothetical protein
MRPKVRIFAPLLVGHAKQYAIVFRLAKPLNPAFVRKGLPRRIYLGNTQAAESLVRLIAGRP